MTKIRLQLRAPMSRFHAAFDNVAHAFPAIAEALAQLDGAMDEHLPMWPRREKRQLGRQFIERRPDARIRQLMVQRSRLRAKVRYLQAQL